MIVSVSSFLWIVFVAFSLFFATSAVITDSDFLCILDRLFGTSLSLLAFILGVCLSGPVSFLSRPQPLDACPHVFCCLSHSHCQISVFISSSSYLIVVWVSVSNLLFTCETRVHLMLSFESFRAWSWDWSESCVVTIYILFCFFWQQHNYYLHPFAQICWTGNLHSLVMIWHFFELKRFNLSFFLNPTFCCRIPSSLFIPSSSSFNFLTFFLWKGLGFFCFWLTWLPFLSFPCEVLKPNSLQSLLGD